MISDQVGWEGTNLISTFMTVSRPPLHRGLCSYTVNEAALAGCPQCRKALNFIYLCCNSDDQ